MSAAEPMMNVRTARSRASSYYESHYREWASMLLVRGCGLVPDTDSTATASGLASGMRPLSLRPPNERQALADLGKMSAWVDEWHAVPEQGLVEWSERHWSSVGTQLLPVRLSLGRAVDVAGFAGRSDSWELVSRRMQELACHLHSSWSHELFGCDPKALTTAGRRCAPIHASLDEGDWRMLLLVLDWLASHPGERRYVRQLPIRGIDTKWLEGHQGGIDPIVSALTGTPLSFAEPPKLVRIRFLDPELAPGGLTDLEAAPRELALLPRTPHLAIVCENLVNTLVIPAMPGAVAIHGGGYAVSALAGITWLAHTRILYWGDLDSHGFAILNELRAHHPHAESLMMDERTLAAHRDLCVVEPKPFLGALPSLTPAEQSTLDLLRGAPQPLRLEQERIEWAYALDRLEEAVGRGPSD